MNTFIYMASKDLPSFLKRDNPFWEIRGYGDWLYLWKDRILGRYVLSPWVGPVLRYSYKGVVTSDLVLTNYLWEDSPVWQSPAGLIWFDSGRWVCGNGLMPGADLDERLIGDFMPYDPDYYILEGSPDSPPVGVFNHFGPDTKILPFEIIQVDHDGLEIGGYPRNAWIGGTEPIGIYKNKSGLGDRWIGFKTYKGSDGSSWGDVRANGTHTDGFGMYYPIGKDQVRLLQYVWDIPAWWSEAHRPAWVITDPGIDMAKCAWWGPSDNPIAPMGSYKRMSAEGAPKPDPETITVSFDTYAATSADGSIVTDDIYLARVSAWGKEVY